MDKIIYIRGTYSKEVQKIELDVTENLDVDDFKRVCKRLASVLGYSPESISEAFDNEPRESKTPIKKILKDDYKRQK
tara:strand:+ start:1531 stop:1761 length:231 start_codon:yes stop_codon:yes gene_type:complete